MRPCSAHNLMYPVDPVTPMPRALHALLALGLACLIALAAAPALACPGDGLLPGSLDLARAEARDARWLRREIESRLPCREAPGSALACMCRPVVELDLVLPASWLERPASAQSAAAKRRQAALRRALLAVGDVAQVQLRLPVRPGRDDRVKLQPAQTAREARRLLRALAPREVPRRLELVAPEAAGGDGRRYVLRVTFA